jgi:hypothetical protein
MWGLQLGAEGAAGNGTVGLPEKYVVTQWNELSGGLCAHDSCQLRHTEHIAL